MPKAILFDLDGTLADTATDFYQILAASIKKEKVSRKTEFSYQDFRATAGLGAVAMVSTAYEMSKEDPKFQTYVDNFLSEYKSIAGTHAVLFPGLLDLLTRLTQMNIPWGIVTDKKRAFTDKLCREFSLPAHVSVCSDDPEIGSNEGKPNRKSLDVACNKLNIDRNECECIYVGDSVKDIEAGKNAEMKTIAVTYGYTTEEKLINSKADIYVTSPTELANCLLNWLQQDNKKQNGSPPAKQSELWKKKVEPSVDELIDEKAHQCKM